MEEAYGKGKQKHKVLDKHKQEVNNREKNSKQGKMTVMVDQLQIKSLRGGEVGGRIEALGNIACMLTNKLRNLI